MCVWVEHNVWTTSIRYTTNHPFFQSSVFSLNHNWRTGSTAHLHILLPPRAKQCLWLNNKTVNNHCSITKRWRQITYVTSTVSINLLLQSTISVITIISSKDYASWIFTVWQLTTGGHPFSCRRSVYSTHYTVSPFSSVFLWTCIQQVYVQSFSYYFIL